MKDNCPDCDAIGVFLTSWSASGCEFADYICPECKRRWTVAE